MIVAAEKPDSIERQRRPGVRHEKTPFPSFD